MNIPCIRKVLKLMTRLYQTSLLRSHVMLNVREQRKAKREETAVCAVTKPCIPCMLEGHNSSLYSMQ